MSTEGKKNKKDIKKKQIQSLVNLHGYYHLPNVVESLLTVSEIRAGMHTPIIELNGIKYDLDDLLSEIAFNACPSAKLFVSETRGYLQYVVRHSTGGADVHVTYTHIGFDYGRPSVCTLEMKPISNELVKAFYNAKPYVEARCLGKEVLKKWKMFKLDQLCDAVLTCNLLLTKPDDFVVACGFLQALMKIAGFGRAYRPNVATQDYPDEAPDPLGFGREVQNVTEHMHELAVEAGSLPVIGDEWIATCTSLWRSTSSGMQTEIIDVTLDDGKTVRIKSKNKLVVGSVKGKELFTRDKMQEVYGKKNYCMIGIRDVPYKATRLIFVCKLDVLHAQVACVGHMVNYISSVGHSDGFLSEGFDSGYFFTGRASMSGIRILDNLVTIAASGDHTVLCGDTDLSSFDNHNVGWNFRVPFIRALKKSFVSDSELFGPDKMSRNELIDAAYGPGRIYDTWWDNTRTAYAGIHERYISVIAPEDMVYFTGKKSDAPIVYAGRAGTRSAKAEETWYILNHVKLDKDLYDSMMVKYAKELRMVSFLDGSDFINLKGEASGELSTLLMNSVVNYCLQRVFIRESKKTSLGRKIEAFKLSVVGDDSECLYRITNTNITVDDVNEYLEFLEQTAGKCGHLLSAMKCFLMTCSSEMVQTHARLGLYLPRNQIMMISSEKPRNIQDPIGFCLNLKRLMCSHVARGYDSRIATIILSLNIKYLTLLSAKETNFKFDKERTVFEINSDTELSRGPWIGTTLCYHVDF